MNEDETLNLITQSASAAIDNKTNIRLRNRKERRAIQKQLGKKNRNKIDAISEIARKLDYIDLIQKLRELNEKKENEDGNSNRGTN